MKLWPIGGGVAVVLRSKVPRIKRIKGVEKNSSQSKKYYTSAATDISD